MFLEGQKEPYEQSAAWRIIALAIGWLILSIFCEFLFGFIAGVFVGLFRIAKSLNVSIIYLEMGMLGACGALLLAAVRRGRIAGHGNISAGLGNNPISRLLIIVVMAAAVAVYAAVLRSTIDAPDPDFVSKTSLVNPWLILFYLLLIGFLVPMSEELFFRGWLWTELQRRWGVLLAGSVTSAIWLAVHLKLGFSRPIVLLPVAIVLAMARYWGRSVRAPIALHTTYNLIATIWPWVMKTVGLM